MKRPKEEWGPEVELKREGLRDAAVRCGELIRAGRSPGNIELLDYADAAAVESPGGRS